jgi:hypothetical protein
LKGAREEEIRVWGGKSKGLRLSEEKQKSFDTPSKI